MTKKEARIILKGLDKVMKRQEEIHEVWEAWNESLTDSYAPMFKDSIVQSYIDGASRGDEVIKDYLEYYAYEVSGMTEAKCTDVNGKEYNVKNKNEFINWWMSN